MSTEYHKIETLYERDEATHRLKQPLVLKNRVYGIVNPWVFTEKIDGTNVRCMWDGATVKYAGKTDNAQLPPDLLAWLMLNVTHGMFLSAFPAFANTLATSVPLVVLYGEGYGAGIQGGGDYSQMKRMILFDVAVVRDDGQGAWWLSDENMRDVATKMALDAVPLIGTMSLAEATEMVRVGFGSRACVKPRAAEGLVGRPAEALFDKKGHRLIVKLKTKDF